MDDVSAQVALDLGGRPYFSFSGNFERPMVGELSTEMIPHFFRSVAIRIFFKFVSKKMSRRLTQLKY